MTELRQALDAAPQKHVTILNTEGKLVYSEELKDFTGRYSKKIDISTNPKGMYFVKVTSLTEDKSNMYKITKN